MYMYFRLNSKCLKVLIFRVLLPLLTGKYVCLLFMYSWIWILLIKWITA